MRFVLLLLALVLALALALRFSVACNNIRYLLANDVTLFVGSNLIIGLILPDACAASLSVSTSPARKINTFTRPISPIIFG